MQSPKNSCLRLFPLVMLFFSSVASALAASAFTADDSLAAAIEAARKTHDESQLQSVKVQLDKKIAQNPNKAGAYYDQARVHAYFADVYEMRKDKKAAVEAIDKGIEAVQHSLQIDDKSADAHSLLADLYGRKISLGNGMFAGPKFGPKVKEENAKAMALDDKNPCVWASLGRQYLMAPKMFGGDVAKAIGSFQKSLAVDPNQDETWVWLAKAFQKQGDKTKARDAIQHALSLDPDSPWIRKAANSLN
ncbi:MAG TPA: tetratricopeptide repeat protein [Candidatus Acidoferrum sp.]|nr:tetratricopeptide repeat protein [Candidatus Acidoferrum sp.]